MRATTGRSFPAGGKHAMRLNFSNAREELINEGIYRMGMALKQELAQR